MKKEFKPVFQKKGEAWTDEQGISIPYNRISKAEAAKEKFAQSIYKDALKASGMLNELHALIRKAEQEVNAAASKEGKKLTVKGSFTWYNFDKSVKVEINSNDTVRFDEAMIASARQKLDEFIEEHVKGTDDTIRQLINSAFHSSNGGLDKSKVLGLCKWKKKINAVRFTEAIELIEESVSIASTKKYYRIWVKDEAGQYQNINLQFSNV